MTQKSPDPARLAELDAALRAMLDAISARPIPGRVLSVVDQLDEGDAEPNPLARRRR